MAWCQAITWANVGTNLGSHMAMLDRNELNFICQGIFVNVLIWKETEIYDTLVLERYLLSQYTDCWWPGANSTMTPATTQPTLY